MAAQLLKKEIKMNNAVLYEKKEGVAIVTLNRPERLNAVNDEIRAGLREKLDDAAKDDEVKVIIVTGAGRGFCAGANLVEGANLGDNIDPGETLEKVYHPFLIDLKNLNVPLITAVNGVAAGAGCSLGVFGDLVMLLNLRTFIKRLNL